MAILAGEIPRPACRRDDLARLRANLRASPRFRQRLSEGASELLRPRGTLDRDHGGPLALRAPHAWTVGAERVRRHRERAIGVAVDEDLRAARDALQGLRGRAAE